MLITGPSKLVVQNFLLGRLSSLLKHINRNMTQVPECVFCRICNEQDPTEIVYKDDEFVVFPDIKPAAKHHYLVVTHDHIPNAKQLTKEHISLVERLVQVGRQVLSEKGADMTDVRLGFHWPPFNSIKHLHLHAISPASSMGFIARLIFRPGTWWFVSVKARSREDVLGGTRNVNVGFFNCCVLNSSEKLHMFFDKPDYVLSQL